MTADDIFAGPILRRAEPGLVAIWLAVKKNLRLSASVRVAGTSEWIGRTREVYSLQIFPALYIYILLVRPITDQPFPTRVLLEYSIAVMDQDGNDDHGFFENIVKADKLAYPGFALPSLYLQSPGSTLIALYGSCRKFHDTKGGDNDGMALADDFIAKQPKAVDARPAILCLLGDQIYADDVHDVAFDETVRLSGILTAGAGDPVPSGVPAPPGKGRRQDYVARYAGFMSNEAKNHLVTVSEYVAMYGLAWNQRNWSKSSYASPIAGLYSALPKVRRLLTNTPTYMMFDDHDVTDDWNLSVRWKSRAYDLPLGRRIIGGALYAFYLFQAWGNDPKVYYDKWGSAILKLNDQRVQAPKQLDDFFLAFNDWEFYTPTQPYVYFLDTRTERGHADGRTATDAGAPAYLKNPLVWGRTVKQMQNLLNRQTKTYPLVIASPPLVFGFQTVDALQKKASALIGPYYLDLEGWAANLKSFLLFLYTCGDADVAMLSGDVHYGYTSTVKFSVFDDEFLREAQARFGMKLPKSGTGTNPTYQYLYSAKFLQLTSSALRNSAPDPMRRISKMSSQYTFFVNNKEEVKKGKFDHLQIALLNAATEHDPNPEFLTVSAADFKPGCAFFQRYNDAFNEPYLAEHNIGYVKFHGRKVSHFFLAQSRAQHERSWDFGSDVYWR
ncbi:MAG: hypothetical protein HY725_07785 [Candidatus Rokubacteria bacterium]|nr:hypothetical protein [Candidatus Rokubacteria bacterium]